MKSVKVLGTAAFVAVALGLTAFMNVKLLNKTNTDDKGFAVVELFTSEGCSSCPPADALVAKIEKESAGKPVYILAYHVDYWDALGWKDQFSNADFSKRQRDYSKVLKSQVYTPQIIVNGKTEFVGSQEATLRSAVTTSLQNVAGTKIALDITEVTSKKASLKYTIDNAEKGTVLQVAVVEKAATSKIGAGENNGRTIAHVQIVRKLQQISLSGNTGTANISLPNGFNNKDWEIIGFLQNKQNVAVTGAARASFLNEGNSSAALKTQ